MYFYVNINLMVYGHYLNLERKKVMKKLLLASIFALASGFAIAQSSVTVYGLLDAGYIGTNYKGTGTSATTNQTTSAFGQNAEQYSRLGFKGTEDLGGGTSAFFTAETGLNPDNSTLSTFNTRQAFVGLKQTGIGQFAVGTQYTPIFNEAALTDPGNLNNAVGNVIFAQSVQGNGNSGLAPFAATSSNGNTSDGFTVRTASSLTFKSDSFSGFSVQGLVTANNQNTTQTNATTGGNNNYSGWGLAGDYTWGKLYATVAYQALKSVTPGSLTSPTPAIWNTTAGGVNTQDNQTYAATTYDFGILKAYAQWINRKATDTIDQSYYAKRQAQQIGVRSYFTPVIEGWASVGNGRVSAFGQTAPTANFVGYQLGSNYYLSKRTNLYAIYGQNKASSIGGVNAQPALSANNYALGLRHTF
jgi:predicted porin